MFTFYLLIAVRRVVTNSTEESDGNETSPESSSAAQTSSGSGTTSESTSNSTTADSTPRQPPAENTAPTPTAAEVGDMALSARVVIYVLWALHQSLWILCLSVMFLADQYQFIDMRLGGLNELWNGP